MALGLVGGVYGIANVFGASAGSAVLDIFGICSLTVMILSLLYAIKEIDFFNMRTSLMSVGVYPFLIIFLVFIPIFIYAEKRADDPVISLRYFTDRNILVTMILSTLSGFVMMGVIFVPQFSENCLKLSTGSGGYLVIILGLFAGLGAPVSGKLIDRYGAKLIITFGFACSIAGALFMMFVTTRHPTMVTVMVGLALSGLGMGFTMGTPVNYMMLANTDRKQSNSALATLSLVRSLGTAIAPAIMVGFIANAGMNVQGNIMAVLPQEISMPDLSGMKTVKINMNAAGEKGMKAADAPDSAIKGMDMLSAQMKAMKDGVPQALDAALQNYLKAIDARSTDIENEFQRTLNEGFYNIYLMTVIAAAIAVITALLYDKKRELG